MQFSFDAVMYYLFGYKVILYFLLSTFFAGSIHPTAGHFIAEHYVMEDNVTFPLRSKHCSAMAGTETDANFTGGDLFLLRVASPAM